MTLNELSISLYKIGLDQHVFGEDADGQLVVFTNLKINDDEELVPFEEDEEQSK